VEVFFSQRNKVVGRACIGRKEEKWSPWKEAVSRAWRNGCKKKIGGKRWLDEHRSLPECARVSLESLSSLSQVSLESLESLSSLYLVHFQPDSL